MNGMNKKIGFTLVVFASLNSARVKARDARRIADLAEIRKALELYFDQYGYYPQSNCGWDCNGYRFSKGDDASWDALAADLKEFIPKLPRDPINNAAGPWNGYYSYAYGNVGRTTQRVQYDLTAQLEDPNHPQRCGVRNWRFYLDNRSWCVAFGGDYNNQIYEASSL